MITYAEKVHQALKGMSDEQAHVLWNALSSYVENGQTAPEEDVYEADPLLRGAEGLLVRLDAVMAEMAEGLQWQWTPPSTRRKTE